MMMMIIIIIVVMTVIVTITFVQFDGTYILCIYYMYIYRVIHQSLRDFRPLRYSCRDGHAEGEHVNRKRDTPSFCPTLQVLDMSTLGDAADVNPVIKFLPHMLHCVAGT